MAWNPRSGLWPAGLSRLPIVARTANALCNERNACIAAGMNDHLARPVDPERFYAIVLHWLPAVGDPVTEARAPPVPAPPETCQDKLRVQLLRG
jgi:two-component system, sensor histidine kinase and response regulator